MDRPQCAVCVERALILLLPVYMIPFIFMLVFYMFNSELNLQWRLQNELSLDNCSMI